MCVYVYYVCVYVLYYTCMCVCIVVYVYVCMYMCMCIYVCFNCTIYEQFVNYIKSRKNFYKTYCNLHGNAYNIIRYTETRKYMTWKGDKKCQEQTAKTTQENFWTNAPQQWQSPPRDLQNRDGITKNTLYIFAQ